MNTDNLKDFAEWFIKDYMKLGDVCGFNEGTINPIIEKFKQSKTIPKKEYEILTMINDGLGAHDFSWQCKLSNEECKIHSVKRLSDGEVFAIGDRFVIKSCSTVIAEVWGFKNNIDGDLCVEYFNGIVKLKKIQKVEDKKPILRCFDGVELFKGDKMVLLSTDSWLITDDISVCENPFYGHNGKFKYFSTKESAMKYIQENKPCLSVDDVMMFFRNHFVKTGDMHPTHGTIRDYLIELVKQKIK